VAPDQPDTFHRVHVDVRMGEPIGVGLDAMRQRIHAGRRRHPRRHRERQVGIDHREVRLQVVAVGDELVVGDGVGDQGAVAGLATRARGGGHLDQRD
jgi:hypothetical protein